jgi:outer membrane biosynthesis protein TonB
MKDADMQLFSIIATGVITTAMSLLVWKSDELGLGWGSSSASTDPYADMEVIDAALAELPKKPDKQPQKKFRAPDPEAKPVGVSRDENAKPVDKPIDEPKPTRDNVPSLDDVRRTDNSDEPVGIPDQQPVGAFDGSEFGFGDETRGDPFLGALKADLLRNWEYPEILSDVGTPVGCIHIEPDGKIEESELREKSGNSELDDSVERALAELQKVRNKDPKPVPAHLIPKTRKWICWRMKVKE